MELPNFTLLLWSNFQNSDLPWKVCNYFLIEFYFSMKVFQVVTCKKYVITEKLSMINYRFDLMRQAVGGVCGGGGVVGGGVVYVCVRVLV